MVRDTSIDAYRMIKENGLLSRVNFDVYAVIHDHGPITIRETSLVLKNQYPATTVSPRFSDLERRGVIRSVEKRPCKITGNVVHSWECTDKLPEELERRKTNKEIIRELQVRVRQLEDENAALRARHEPTPEQAIGQLSLFNQAASKAFLGIPVRP